MFGSNISKPRRKCASAGSSFPCQNSATAERHVPPDETGRIVKPFGDTQRLLGKMLRLLHLE